MVENTNWTRKETFGWTDEKPNHVQWFLQRERCDLLLWLLIRPRPVRPSGRSVWQTECPRCQTGNFRTCCAFRLDSYRGRRQTESTESLSRGALLSWLQENTHRQICSLDSAGQNVYMIKTKRVSVQTWCWCLCLSCSSMTAATFVCGFYWIVADQWFGPFFRCTGMNISGSSLGYVQLIIYSVSLPRIRPQNIPQFTLVCFTVDGYSF